MKFQDIKIGDIVGFPQRNSFNGKRPHVHYRKLTVTRVTATQFACGTARFKKDGYQISGPFTRCVPWTTELDEQHAEQVTAQRLYDRVVSSLQAVEAMHRHGELNAQAQRQLDAALQLAVTGA